MSCDSSLGLDFWFSTGLDFVLGLSLLFLVFYGLYALCVVGFAWFMFSVLFMVDTPELRCLLGGGFG